MTLSARRFFVVACVIAALAPPELTASSLYLPHLRFRVLVTPHFRIYYHQRGENLAREVAAIAESIHRELPTRLGLPAPATTHVVIADQDDASNGSAFPLPYNTIRLTAAWPSQAELIGNTRNWLRLVFAHEYAHILHLDQKRGWAAVLGAVFGRSPVAYPNLALPMWQIEGFATWVESKETGEGRLLAGDSASLVRERMRQVGPEPIDRYNGGLVDWPSGNGPYLYGGFFHQYLAARFGEEKLGELTRRQAGTLHYFGARAYSRVFGASLPSLWADFQRSTLAGTQAAVPAVRGDSPGAAASPRQLTRDGFFVSSPRFNSAGTALMYSARNAHRFPAVMMLQGGERPSLVATQYGGDGLSVGSRVVFFDQLDLEGNVALRGDLYAAVPGGKVRRLTEGARLLQPAISPDGRSLVCVRIEDGRRQLAWFDVEYDRDGLPRLTRRPGPAGDAAHFGSPRWSADGLRVAAERRLHGGPSEIVVMEVATGSTVVVAASEEHRAVTPSWTPDGQRIVFSSDRPLGPGKPTTRSFQLHVVPASGGEAAALTAVTGGAMSPEISPDGKRLVYVGYTARGYDIFEMPFPELAQGPTPAPPRSLVAPPVEVARPAALTPTPTGEIGDRAYSPLPTLLPRAWSPVADNRDDTLRLGVATGGFDVLGRHAWGAMVLWRVTGEHEGMNGRHGRPDWSAAYTYDRWRTPLFVSASDDTDFLSFRGWGGARMPSVQRTERSVRAGIAVPFVSVRRAQMWRAAFNYERQTISAGDVPRVFARHAIEAAWQLNSSRRFGYSISPEEGAAIGVTTEQVRRAFGADGDAQAWTMQARGFQRLGGRHAVLAARVGAGISRGDAAVRRTFFLGGASPAGPVVNFGSDALVMLRGLESQAYAGWRVAGGSLEYRFPLLRVERGWRTMPLFLRAAHAAVFADGGHAWDRDFSWRDIKTSVGAEVSVDVVVGFGLPATLSAGVAWARDGATGQRHNATPYLRIGRSF